MAALTWSDALAVGHARIDDTHREFVALLAEVEAALQAPLTELAERLAAFAAHTAAHFAQEEAWMLELGFAPETCHFFQHRQVLEVVTLVQKRLAEQADTESVSLLVRGLVPWFTTHAASLDAPLAEALALRDARPTANQAD